MTNPNGRAGNGDASWPLLSGEDWTVVGHWWMKDQYWLLADTPGLKEVNGFDRIDEVFPKRRLLVYHHRAINTK